MDGTRMEQRTEQTIVSGMFGTVTDRRVIYNREKSWFSGGSREDIPLKHVTSVRLETNRHLIWGILLVLLGLSSVKLGIGLIFLLFGVLFIWGSPMVVVNTSGRDKNASQGWPWQKGAALEFVEAVRHQLIAE